MTASAMTRKSPSFPTTSLSLILPAFNEEESITTAIAEASRSLARLADAWEVIVVDDGSRDGTAAAVEQARVGNPNLRLVSHHPNRGYGAALRSGFEAARYQLVAFTDADCQFHLDDLAHLLRLIGGHDVVCGYRVDRKDTWLRRFYSGCYNVVVNALLGVPVRDCDCALKLFRVSALRDVRIDTNGFLVNAELLAKLAMSGHRICEVGVRHRPRLDGRSTVSPLHAIPVAAALIRFWWTWVLFPPPAPLVPLVSAEDADKITQFDG